MYRTQSTMDERGVGFLLSRRRHKKNFVFSVFSL